MPDENNVNIPITKVTAQRPTRLSKGFRLRDGTLEKMGGGVLVAGTAEKKKLHLSNINDLADVLTGLNTKQALVYGVTEHERAQVVTKKALEAYKPNGGPPVISRTKEYFSWRSGPGIFMKDGDFPQGSMDPTEYLDLIYSQCDGLRDCQHLLAHSAGSHIYNKQSGEMPQGCRRVAGFDTGQERRRHPTGRESAIQKAVYCRSWIHLHLEIRLNVRTYTR